MENEDSAASEYVQSPHSLCHEDTQPTVNTSQKRQWYGHNKDAKPDADGTDCTQSTGGCKAMASHLNMPNTPGHEAQVNNTIVIGPK